MDPTIITLVGVAFGALLGFFAPIISSLLSVKQEKEMDCTPDCRQLVKQQYLRQPPFRTAQETYNQVMNAASSSCTLYQ